MTETSAPYRVLNDGKDRKKMLASRSAGIGASEISAVLNFSKFQSPYDIWEKKTGRAPALEQTQAMEFGTALERVIADRFSVRHGHNPSKNPEHRPIGKLRPSPGVLQSIKYPFLLATPDRVLELFDRDHLAPLEIKTAGAWVKSDWDEGVPLYYQPQNQQQQLVMHGLDGAEIGYIAPLLGGNDMPDPFELEFDRQFAEEYLIEKVGEWYQRHIVEDTPPPLTLKDDVNRIYPAMRGKPFVATPRLLELVAERNDLQPKMSADKKRDDEIKAEIKLAMLETTVLTTKLDDEGKPTDVLLTWDLPKTLPKTVMELDVEALKASQPLIFEKFAKSVVKPQSRTMTFKK
jgi:putative phage-type endonuclease